MELALPCQTLPLGVGESIRCYLPLLSPPVQDLRQVNTLLWGGHWPKLSLVLACLYKSPSTYCNKFLAVRQSLWHDNIHTAICMTASRDEILKLLQCFWRVFCPQPEAELTETCEVVLRSAHSICSNLLWEGAMPRGLHQIPRNGAPRGNCRYQRYRNMKCFMAPESGLMVMSLNVFGIHYLLQSEG